MLSYFTIEFSGCLGVHSVVNSVNSVSLYVALVLSTNVEKVWLSVWTLWSLFVRKSNLQLQSVV